MMNAGQQCFFQRMRKRPMTNIVQENGDLRGFKFYFTDVDIFFAQAFKRPAHQMHGSNRMMKSRMHRSGVNKVTDTQLTDESQSLKILMRDEIEDQRAG